MESSLYPILDSSTYLELYVVPGTPVLYLKDIDAIILSDLHLGFEEAAARGLNYSYGRRTRSIGMFLPRVQLKKIISVLSSVFEIVKPRRVIINGDLKHAFDQLLKQEREEVSNLLSFIYSNGVYDIMVVRGNHDNFLPGVLKKYNVSLYTRYEYVTSNYKLLITHGHLEIDPGDYDVIVIGHEHPSIRCFGYSKTPVFIKIPIDTGRFIVCTPAVSPYHPGTNVGISRENYLSPIIKNYGDLSRARVISWIELDVSNSDYIKDIYSDLVVIKYYSLKNKKVALIEFSSIETAVTICGSLQ